MGTWNGIELDDLVIASERLTFRPWRATDAGEVAAIMTAPAMHEYLPLPDPYTRQDAEQFVTGFGVRGRRDGTAIAGAVVETATGRLAGAAELRLPGRREVSGEIGYWVGVSTQGNGYAAETTRALAGWAFAHGVQRLEIRCAVGNLASAKTALAAGFQFEAISRSKEMTPRGPRDGALFARLAGDPDHPIAAAFPPLPAGDLTDGTVGLRAVAADDLDAVHAERVNDEAMHWAFQAETPERTESEQIAAHAPLRWLVGPDADSGDCRDGERRDGRHHLGAPIRAATGGAAELRRAARDSGAAATRHARFGCWLPGRFTRPASPGSNSGRRPTTSRHRRLLLPQVSTQRACSRHGSPIRTAHSVTRRDSPW